MNRHRIVIDSAFPIGAIVCLRTEPAADADRGMVTALTLRCNGVEYLVAWGRAPELRHDEIELRFADEPGGVPA